MKRLAATLAASHAVAIDDEEALHVHIGRSGAATAVLLVRTPWGSQIWDVRTVSALEKKPKYRALLASQLQDFEVRSDTGSIWGRAP